MSYGRRYAYLCHGFLGEGGVGNGSHLLSVDYFWNLDIGSVPCVRSDGYATGRWGISEIARKH
jgi:hypothetical protein